MKIGNITFQWSYNCGSILQCMALRRVLSEHGHEVDVINFSTPEQRKLYSVFYPWKGLRNIAKNLLCMPGRETIAEHYRQYDDYIRRQFGYASNPMGTVDELRKNLPRYDVLVAGGDQVWNVNCSDFSTAYMLDFGEGSYKFSYSPSLGATDINCSSHALEYAALLNRFDDISCREPNGQARLERLTGRKVTLALDPTLLLSADEWREEISDSTSLFDDGDFIFYYAFSYSQENNVAIQKLAESLNMPVVIIDAKQWYIRRLWRYGNFVLSEETGPNAFLRYMDRATYVVTTSFHGTAFSVVYDKRFAYINIPKHDAGDDRTSFLVERLGLGERFIAVDELDVGMLDSAIDYGEVRRRLKGMQNESLEYLDRNLRLAANGI